MKSKQVPDPHATHEIPRAVTQSSSTSSRVLLFVLGMHRSGTSALTRTLNLLGASLPSRLMPADPESNAAGFWESIDIANLNDRLLREYGRTWDDVRETPALTDDDAVLEDYRTRAVEILERDFGAGESLVVIKDPRICRLVPFWKAVAESAGFTPRFLLAVRHPSEVAASLAKRDGLGEERANQLWQRYLLEAELSTRGSVRTVVLFETLMSDWISVASTVARELEIEWPHSPEAMGEGVSGFLSSGLRNHKHRQAEAKAGSSARLYDTFRGAEGSVGKLTSKEMDEALSRLDAEIAVHRGLLDEYQGGLLRCRSEVARRLDEIEALRLGASSLEEWAEKLAASLESAKDEQTKALNWVVESLFEGLDVSAPGSNLPLGTQVSLGLEATHRWRVDARRQAARASEELALAESELSNAHEELAVGRSKLEAAIAEGKASSEGLRRDLQRANEERAQAVEELTARGAALQDLQSRFEALSEHAERMEAKIDLVRRVPLAGWLWDVVSRFR